MLRENTRKKWDVYEMEVSRFTIRPKERVNVASRSAENLGI